MRKKTNNKGLTVVELIISFALLVIIVLGMYNIIISIKDYSVDKNFEREKHYCRNNWTRFKR